MRKPLIIRILSALDRKAWLALGIFLALALVAARLLSLRQIAALCAGPPGNGTQQGQVPAVHAVVRSDGHRRTDEMRKCIEPVKNPHVRPPGNRTVFRKVAVYVVAACFSALCCVFCFALHHALLLLLSSFSLTK